MLRASRRPFYPPECIERAVEATLATLDARGEPIDYVTFVATGEPTLDANLGEAIRRLKRLPVKVAVVTNASMLWQPRVADDLAPADWISLKVDTVRDATWHRLNRPHRRLGLARILRGLRDLSRTHGGPLNTETMLVAGVNDSRDELQALADHLGDLRPACAYLSLPLRPPVESWVRPSRHGVAMAADLLERAGIRAVPLTSDEDDTFSGPDDVVVTLLATAAVHPLREEAVGALLQRFRADWTVVERLVRNGRLRCQRYRGRRFYRSAPR
jgi:wyosine [tRNA(Phe)-imidazoG37] synthetase (radical SAM superfamily)